jgi:hypothetical protein
VGSCIAVGYYAYAEGGHFVPMVATETAGKWGKAEEVKLPANAATIVSKFAFAFLNSVACSPSGTCIAVGSYFEETEHLGIAMTATKMAGTWEATELPHRPAHSATSNFQEVLDSISCPAAGACVAAGGYLDESLDGQSMVVDQSGGAWETPTEIAPPEGAEADPRSIAAVARVPCLGIVPCGR